MRTSRATTNVILLAVACALGWGLGASPARAQTSGKRSEAVAKTLQAFVVLGGDEARPWDPRPDRLEIEFRKGITDDDLRLVRDEIERSPLPIELRLAKAFALTDDGLKHLVGLEGLVGLSLEGNRFTGLGIAHLVSLKNLQSLTIASSDINDEGLAPIGKMTWLRKLLIFPKDYDKQFTPTSYSLLADLVNLEQLRVRPEVTDDELRYLTKLKKLSEVRIEGRRFVDPTVEKDALFTDAGMAHLGELTGLKTLRLDGLRITPAGYAHLAKLTNLESLHLNDCHQLSGETCAVLASLVKLKEIGSNSGAKLDAAAGTHLGKLPELTTLKWDEIEPGSLSGLAAAPKLAEVRLEDAGVVDADMESIGRIKTLKKLNLQRNKITDAGVRHLAGLTELKELSISRTQLTDESLAVIGQLKNLEQLGIEECKLTGTGLKQLASCTKLRDIWFGGNPITDEHLPELAKLASLEAVFLPDTKTTAAGAIALKRDLPKAWISDVAGADVKIKTPPAMPKTSPADSPKTVDLMKVEPKFKLTAEQFAKEYLDVVGGAQERYLGQVVEISGEVRRTERVDGKPVLYLITNHDDRGMVCATVDEEPWARYALGQKVRVRGTAKEYRGIPELAGTVVVDPGEYTGLRTTPQDLANRCAADAAKFQEEFSGKFVVLTGTAAARVFNRVGGARVTLETEGPIKVECHFASENRDLATKIELGKPVVIAGELTLVFDKDKIEVYECLPVAGKQ